MLNILEISRMANHNGPGYRTTVHFMGCPLHCKWCSTPESQDFTGLSQNLGRCISCGSCVGVCKTEALTLQKGQPVALDRSKCNLCYECTKVCYSNALRRYGTPYTARQLADEILKDKLFFENSGGGVTFSGGECMINVNEEFLELCSYVYQGHVSMGFDTSGQASWKQFEDILPYADFFLYDIKILDSDKHKKYTGVGNELILENLQRLTQLTEYHPKLFIRYPLIPDINDTDEDIRSLCSYLLMLNNISELNFLPYHHLGISRYQFSGKLYTMGSAERQPDERLIQICDIADQMGVPNRVVG